MIFVFGCQIHTPGKIQFRDMLHCKIDEYINDIGLGHFSIPVKEIHNGDAPRLFAGGLQAGPIQEMPNGCWCDRNSGVAASSTQLQELRAIDRWTPGNTAFLLKMPAEAARRK